MTAVSRSALQDFCNAHGLPASATFERIRAGRNSEVWKLRDGNQAWILKNYYRKGADDRDRLGTEFTFLGYLEVVGVPNVARPLGMDSSAGLALYSCLPGNRPEVIDSSHVSRAAGFIGAINRPDPNGLSASVHNAADACFSGQDHLALVDARVARLMTLDAASDLEAEARRFVTEEILPCWVQLKAELSAAWGSARLREPLSPDVRILSPSDFGFHNTLEHSGELYFVDFEYAGWDDPAKLICDFACQPELPVTESQGREFCDYLLASFPQPDALERRAQAFLPVHRLKWSCILLNEFRIEDRRRRQHAGLDSEGLLSDQLEKARNYFFAHLSPSN